MSPNHDFRPGSKRGMIADLAERGKSKTETYGILRPLVIAQESPMVFKSNVPNGPRTPKPIAEQLVELKNEIGRVYKAMGRAKDNRFDSEEIKPEEIPVTIKPEEETKEPEISGFDPKKEMREWLAAVKRLRRFCIERSRMGETLDSIGHRPSQMAGRLIPRGIPASVLLLACTMHWAPDIRRDAGIDDFDFGSDGNFKSHPGMLEISQRVIRERGITEVNGETVHELFGYVLLLAEARVPVMLIGPAGTGKSHLAEQIADYLEIPYGETPMSAGASRSDLLGRHTISQETPFISSEFTGIYSGGGVFSFEEIDRSDPGITVTLNNALARKRFFNSTNGKVYDKSGDFCAFATANTFGLGANSAYTAGERLDAAVLDRFRMGRVYLPIDETLEDVIFHAEISSATA